METRNPESGSKAAVICFLSLFILALSIPFGLGLALVYQWIALASKAQAARDWPVADGWVVSARFDRRETADSSISVDYDMQYEYVVDQIHYQSSRLSLEPSRNVEIRELRNLGVKFAPGAAVRVFYDPRNPADALLSPGGGPHWSSLLLGIILSASPAVVLVPYFRREKVKRPV